MGPAPPSHAFPPGPSVWNPLPSLLCMEVSGASSGPSRLPLGAAIFVPGSVLRRSHVLLHFCLPFYLATLLRAPSLGVLYVPAQGTLGHSVLLCVLPSPWNYLSTFPYLDK